MHIAILTFEGFNELDSLIALGILNRVKRPGWRVSIASPTQSVRSMNGVVIHSQANLQDAAEADAVIVGSAIIEKIKQNISSDNMERKLKLYATTMKRPCRQSH